MTDYEPDLTILQQLLCMTYFCILLIFTLVSIEKSVRFKPKHIHISFIRIPTALSIYRSLSLSHLYLLMLLSRAIMCMSTSFLQKNTRMYLLIHFLDFIFYHVKVQNIKTWKTAKKEMWFHFTSPKSPIYIAFFWSFHRFTCVTSGKVIAYRIATSLVIMRFKSSTYSAPSAIYFALSNTGSVLSCTWYVPIDLFPWPRLVLQQVWQSVHGMDCRIHS